MHLPATLHLFGRLLTAACIAALAQLACAQVTGLPAALGLGVGVAPTPAASAPRAGTGASTAPQGVEPSAAVAERPLPLDPAQADKPVVFGSQLFTGRIGHRNLYGFNPDHLIADGDRLNVRMWGAFSFNSIETVDAHGNIFLPNVGPVPVRGVRNADLTRIVELHVRKVFKANVQVYVTLDAAQPVQVYVTGFVRAPGLYDGRSSDSVLAFLDRAGGIDPDRGSYLEVSVQRAGQRLAAVNLYDFLLRGEIRSIQFRDADTIVVAPRRHTVRVAGEVLNPYIFEFNDASVQARSVLALAQPRPGATHLSVVRMRGAERRSEYFALSELNSVELNDGDEVTLTSDRFPGTILVRVEGAHLGARTLVLPYGATLRDAVGRIVPAPQALMSALQLYRRSVAERQRELIESSLRSMETYALTARSATSEEATLRTKEGAQILEFIDRARRVQPRGQVVLSANAGAQDMLLEDGDLISVPTQTKLVLVSGEVVYPAALVHDSGAGLQTYVERAGGFTQGADQSRIIVLHRDGSVSPQTQGERAPDIGPGDEIMVLPKIETKSVEVTRGITQIIYQIAVAAKVLFGL